MDCMRSSKLHRSALVHCIDLGRTLTVVVMLGLVMLLTVSLAVIAVVSAGIVPTIDRSIALPAQHQLLIHIGPRPTCWFIPNPPQHDCIWPGAERGVFSMDYLTPHSARSLVWVRLPSR